MSQQHPAKPAHITLETLPTLFAYNRFVYGGFAMEDTGGDGGNDDTGGDGGGGGNDGGDNPPEEATDEQGRKLGYPKNTKVADMTPEQERAYNRHQTRRHEARATSWQKAAGDRDPDKLRQDLEELEKLRRGKLSDSDKAVEDARKEEREKVTAESVPVMVTAAFELLLDDMEPADFDDYIETLNLSAFVKDGRVDTAKVKRHAAKVSGKTDGDGKGGRGNRRPDLGGGSRRNNERRTEGSAGKAEATRRFAKDKKTD